jgi:hypothetical protein
VHEDGADADARQEHQVADHRLLQLRRLHRRAAVLHDDGLSLEPLDEGECLRQHVHCRGRGRRRGLSLRHRSGSDAEPTVAAGGEESDAASGQTIFGERRGRDGNGRIGLGEDHGGNGRSWCSTKCQARLSRVACGLDVRRECGWDCLAGGEGTGARRTRVIVDGGGGGVGDECPHRVVGVGAAGCV